MSRDVHSCSHWLRPRNPPLPAFGFIYEGRYWSAKIDEISLKPPGAYCRKKGWGRSQSIRPRVRPVPNKSLNTLWEDIKKFLRLKTYLLKECALAVCGLKPTSLLRFFSWVAHIGSEVAYPSVRSAQIIISKTIPFRSPRPYCKSMSPLLPSHISDLFKWIFQRLNMELDLHSLFGLHVTWCA